MGFYNEFDVYRLFELVIIGFLVVVVVVVVVVVAAAAVIAAVIVVVVISQLRRNFFKSVQISFEVVMTICGTNQRLS